MKCNFIELPVYEHPYRKSVPYSPQLININSIIRVYVSDSRDYMGETFIELTRQFNTNEPLRVALAYDDVLNILKLC